MARLFKLFNGVVVISFLQACCMFGSYETDIQVWETEKDLTPFRSVIQQSQLCAEEVLKECKKSYQMTCSDIESGQRKLKLINNATGEEIRGNALKRVEDNCTTLKANPEFLNQWCSAGSTSSSQSCMEKNGYLQKNKSVRRCSGMKML
jgi:hypothetical protein